jgi:hypothetical protein
MQLCYNLRKQINKRWIFICVAGLARTITVMMVVLVAMADVIYEDSHLPNGHNSHTQNTSHSLQNKRQSHPQTPQRIRHHCHHRCPHPPRWTRWTLCSFGWHSARLCHCRRRRCRRHRSHCRCPNWSCPRMRSRREQPMTLRTVSTHL